ncbi:hypothetical protein C3L33_22356, partial [Rhododendron williamsianum]
MDEKTIRGRLCQKPWHRTATRTAPSVLRRFRLVVGWNWRPEKRLELRREPSLLLLQSEAQKNVKRVFANGIGTFGRVTGYMASNVVNFPCNIGAIKGLDCATFAGFKPSVNQSFVCVRPVDKACNRRLFTVRASEKHDIPFKKTGLSDEECEAAVVAGNAPEAPPPPPRPAAPAGTPVVSSILFRFFYVISFNDVKLFALVDACAAFGWFQPLNRRPRRNRRSPALRAAFQETSISPANFVYPLFIHEGEEDTPIGAMPGCYRLGGDMDLLKRSVISISSLCRAKCHNFSDA